MFRSGAKKGTQPSTCGTCGGHGQVRMQQGFFSVQQTCPKCQGSEKLSMIHVMIVRGQEGLKNLKRLSVKIPAGVDEGDRIRLSNEGEAGVNGGPSGDLYVGVALKNMPFLKGMGLTCTANYPSVFQSQPWVEMLKFLH